MNEEPITALAIREEPAQLEPIPPGPSYVQGFEGIASSAFPPESQTVLTAPVNPADVLMRPDGIVYLPGVWYRRRLTAAFGAGAWALAPRGPAQTHGDLVIYHGALYVQGRYVSEAVGECKYQASNRGMTYAQALEGARTDCLTRCCKDLLMGSELWDKEWIERWKQANTRGGKKDIPAPTVAPPPPPAPKANIEPVVWTTDDFLAKCAVALEWAGEAEFRKALDLFRVKNPGDVTEADRHRFIVYLRKLPKVKP